MDRLNIAGALIPEHSPGCSRRGQIGRNDTSCVKQEGAVAATANKFVVLGTIGPRSTTNVLW